MINCDNITKENIKYCNLNWPQVLAYPYRISIIGDSESGKTNALLNLEETQHGDYSITDTIEAMKQDINI